MVEKLLEGYKSSDIGKGFGSGSGGPMNDSCCNWWNQN